MATLSPPTSEVGGLNPRPYVGKLVVAYRWLAVVQNRDELYLLVSSAHKTTCHDMTCTVISFAFFLSLW